MNAAQQLEACSTIPALQLWGALHAFVVGVPDALARAAAAGYSATRSALWSLVVAAAGAAYAVACALARPVGAAAAWVGRLLLTNIVLVVASLASFVAWQVYYAPRYLVRLAARLPALRGVTLELPPAPDAPRTSR